MSRARVEHHEHAGHARNRDVAVGAEEFFEYDIAARQSVLTDRRGGDRLVVDDDSRRDVYAGVQQSGALGRRNPAGC